MILFYTIFTTEFFIYLSFSFILFFKYIIFLSFSIIHIFLRTLQIEKLTFFDKYSIIISIKKSFTDKDYLSMKKISKPEYPEIIYRGYICYLDMVSRFPGIKATFNFVNRAETGRPITL